MTETTEATVILIAAAVIPALFLMIRIYRADRMEKEPAGLLLSLLLLGILATAIAAFLEEVGDIVVSYFFPEGTLEYDLIIYFLIVAVSEEGFKYLLMKARTWRNPNFNCTFDGVVYAVFVSMGFALWENISYVMAYGMGAAVARALTAVPGHACFGVFMGSWYGMAKRLEAAGLWDDSRRALRRAFWIPVLLHGLYDFIAMRMIVSLTLGFVAFVGLMFILSLRRVKREAQNDSYIEVNEYIE